MKVWDSESEERVAPRLRRAVWSVDEEDGEREPATGRLRAAVAAPPSPGADWEDDYEGPVRGKLRRALQAVD